MQWSTGLSFYNVAANLTVGESHIFNKMPLFSSYKWFTQQWESLSSNSSATEWATGLQFYYVKADPKVGD